MLVYHYMDTKQNLGNKSPLTIDIFKQVTF